VNVTEAKRWLLAEAAVRGVDLEVLATRQSRLFIEAHDGRTSEISNSSRGGVGLRVVDGGKVGYASTEELSEAALGWALDEAIENASLQPDGAAVLPAGGNLGRHDLLSEGLSAPVEAKAAAAANLENGIKQDPRVQSVQHARYYEGADEVEIGSSRGVDGSYRAGMAALVTSLVMRDGTSVKQGFKADAQADFYHLEPGTTAQDALRRIGRQLGARPLSTGRRRAVLEPEVVAQLLGLFVYSLSGKTVAEGKSRLAQSLGQSIASELITVVDDPTLPNGLGSRPFDSEGTPSQRLVLVENGVLRSFLHNTDTARRTGQRTTGHAQRTYASVLSVGTSNLILESGAGIPAGDGILVTDLMGLHAGANPITGDVSLQAMGMEMIGGEQAPVDDFAVSFNLFELLRQVEAVGDDSQWIAHSSSCRVPSLAVGEISFAGS